MLEKFLRWFNMEDLARLGISKLEKAFGGYLKHGTTITITGPTGIGKSVLAMQLLINGIKFGERGLYIVMEFNKNYFYQTFEGFNWNIKEYEEAGMLMVIDYPFTEIGQFIGQGNPLKEIIKKYNIKRVVVDSIKPIVNQASNEQQLVDYLIKTSNKIKEWGTLNLVISESENYDLNSFPKSPFNLESYFDCWISMNFEINKEEWKRWLAVIKSKHKHTIKPLYFSIEKNGIIIED
jgi:circadian clock protein KaiC